MNSMNNMGKFIAEKRRQSGLTQEAFADKLGITPQAVSKWENNVGLPDITLLPSISKVLNVSIDEMFDKKTNKKEASFPEEFKGLKFIFSKGNKACYSLKELELIDDDGNVLFKDGSAASLNDGFIENRGVGEIIIYETDDYFEDSDEEVKNEIEDSLPHFNSISMTMHISCTIGILTSENGEGKIEASGSKKFMKALKYEVKENTLEISTESRFNVNGNEKNNKLNIYVPFESGENLKINVNGSSTCNVVPKFENTKITINGSGCVRGTISNELTAMINGSGDVLFDSVLDKTTVKINGSGDIAIQDASNVEAAINGSGDIAIRNVTKNFSAQIAGAGDVTVGGEVENFYCKIAGSGDIDAKKLTVSSAEIVLDGASDVTIGRIINFSKERISKASTLTVLQRG